MKGCRPKEIEKGRCKLYDSQFSKSIKRQVVSYSYTDTLPKGKSREIKNIRIPRPKSLRNDIKLYNSYTLIISIGMGSSSTATQKIVVRNNGS